MLRNAPIRAYTELKARGVRFEAYDMPSLSTKDGIVTAGGAKTAWFRDTEGNIMAVSRRLGGDAKGPG